MGENREWRFNQSYMGSETVQLERNAFGNCTFNYMKLWYDFLLWLFVCGIFFTLIGTSRNGYIKTRFNFKLYKGRLYNIIIQRSIDAMT